MRHCANLVRFASSAKLSRRYLDLLKLQVWREVLVRLFSLAKLVLDTNRILVRLECDFGSNTVFFRLFVKSSGSIAWFFPKIWKQKWNVL